MCCTYSIICWLNPKIFLSILVVFGKCFVSKIFTKIQKFSTLLFGNSLASHEFSKPSHKFTQKCSQLYGKWDFQSWKTLRKFFKNLGFSLFGDSFSWLLHKWKSKSWVHLEAFATHWQVEIPVVKKDLEKFFKILFKGFWRLNRG